MCQGPPSRIALPLLLAAGLSAGPIGAVPARAGQADAGVALSSDYVVYGLTRSRGKPAAQAQVGWADESGWSLGTWFSTVEFDEGRSASRELDVYLAKRWALGKDLALLTELTQYTFNEPANEPSYDYSELRLALSFREWLELSASVSPNFTAPFYYTAGAYAAGAYTAGARQQTAITYGATAHFPANRRLAFNVGAGRFDLQQPIGHGYTFWNAGGEVHLGRFDLALTYIGTDHAATRLFDDSAGDRFVATLALRLR